MSKEAAFRYAGLEPPSKRVVGGEVRKGELREMATEVLAQLIQDMRSSPDAYRASEIIAACKEALDRTEGKPVQTAHVSMNQSYTIISAIPAPPNSLTIEGEVLDGE